MDNWRGTVLSTMRAIKPSFASGEMSHAQSEYEALRASVSEQLHNFDRSLGLRHDEAESEYDRFEVLRDVLAGESVSSLDGKYMNTVGLQKIVIRHAAELEAKLGVHYEGLERIIFRYSAPVQPPSEADSNR